MSADAGIAMDAAREAASAIGIIWQESRRELRENPAPAYAFHTSMMRQFEAGGWVPFKWLRIRYHKLRARRAFAWAEAKGQTKVCKQTAALMSGSGRMLGSVPKQGAV